MLSSSDCDKEMCFNITLESRVQQKPDPKPKDKDTFSFCQDDQREKHNVKHSIAYLKAKVCKCKISVLSVVAILGV